MPAKKGRSFVLQHSDGTSPVSYTTIAGLRSNSIAINNELVDITNKDDSGWRKGLEQGGVKSVTLSGSGVFTDSTTEGLIRTAMLNGTHELLKIKDEDNDEFQGTFQVTSLEYAGEYNGEITYSMTFESVDEVTYTAG